MSYVGSLTPHYRKEIGEFWPAGQIFCMICALRMVFTLLNGWKKSQKKIMFCNM